MDRPRILIIGKNGQVGWELCRAMVPLGDVAAVDYPEIDLSDEKALRQTVRAASPEVIVNAAAYTAVDKAEAEAEIAGRINGRAPCILADEASRAGSLLIHYSTDYVYDGSKSSPYLEDDMPNPLSAYGRTKLEGDLAVQKSGCRHLIFRLCWVYGARGHNFMRTIMRLAAERDKMRIVADQVGCPTWSRMIAEATAFVLSQVLNGAGEGKLNTVYHLAASGRASWHEFATEIVRLMPENGRKCGVVEPITTREYPLPARRPSMSILDCGKLERSFGLRLPDWKTSLQQIFQP